MSGFPFLAAENKYLQQTIHLNSEETSQSLCIDLEEPV